MIYNIEIHPARLLRSSRIRSRRSVWGRATAQTLPGS